MAARVKDAVRFPFVADGAFASGTALPSVQGAVSERLDVRCRAGRKGRWRRWRRDERLVAGWMLLPGRTAPRCWRVLSVDDGSDGGRGDGRRSDGAQEADGPGASVHVKDGPQR